MRFNRRNNSTLRRQMLRDDPRCAYCSRELTIETATIDHRVPRCRGGTDAPDNLVLACDPCNQSKGDLTDAEYLVEAEMETTPG